MATTMASPSAEFVAHDQGKRYARRAARPDGHPAAPRDAAVPENDLTTTATEPAEPAPPAPPAGSTVVADGPPPAADPTPPAVARPKKKRLWITKILKRAGIWFGTLVVPRLYMMYMWFVYVTSRHEHRGCTPAILRERYGKGIFVLWHEEVFFVAYAFKQWHGSTLASHGAGGGLIAKMLQLCNFTVFRGGSSRSRKRRAADIVNDMVEYLNRRNDVIYGITVDGSTGPVYRMKNGAAKIAVRCQAPIGVEKTWCKRYYRFNNWDGTMIPLPFNHIIHLYGGPYLPPPHDADRATKKAYLREVEADLARLSCYARYEIEGKAPPAEWLAKFPEHVRESLPTDGGEFVLERAYDPVGQVPPTELGMQPLTEPDANAEEATP